MIGHVANELRHHKFREDRMGKSMLLGIKQMSFGPNKHQLLCKKILCLTVHVITTILISDGKYEYVAHESSETGHFLREKSNLKTALDVNKCFAQIKYIRKVMQFIHFILVITFSFLLVYLVSLV